MSYERLKPIKKTNCYAVEDISGDSYLFDHNPTEDMWDPSEVDHLYREIVEGVFYPIKNVIIINDKKLVGYFLDEVDREYKCVYESKGEFSLDTDMDWLPISKEILDAVI